MYVLVAHSMFFSIVKVNGEMLLIKIKEKINQCAFSTNKCASEWGGEGVLIFAISYLNCLPLSEFTPKCQNYMIE